MFITLFEELRKHGRYSMNAANRRVGVAIGPLTEEELGKMSLKTIKPLLKERGINVKI